METHGEQQWSHSEHVVAIRFAARTDRGLVRRVNEDSILARPPVFLVADGMGGHAHGDRASQAVAQVFEAEIAGGAPTDPDAVLAAVRRANEVVHAIGEDQFAGTTVAGVALVVSRSEELQWLIFNVGDSRVYEFADGALTQLSVDHSAVQELLDAGTISVDDVENHPERNVVTRAIGPDFEPQPDVWLRPAAGARTFVLCTDGLTKELDDAAIGRIVRESELSAAATRLVDAALAGGGRDNVSAVVLEATVERRAEPHRGADADPEQLEHLMDTLPRN